MTKLSDEEMQALRDEIRREVIEEFRTSDIAIKTPWERIKNVLEHELVYLGSVQKNQAINALGVLFRLVTGRSTIRYLSGESGELAYELTGRIVGDLKKIHEAAQKRG